MYLAHLRLRDFRNYARLDVDFQPGFQLFLGNNAQGKTNILEAIYLSATLRSFRGTAGAQMVRHGQKGYFVGTEFQSDLRHESRIYWSMHQRSLHLDAQPVRRLSDYLGVFRAVVFSSDDLQLVKGTAGRRRRYLDLLLTQTRPHYLGLLQRYAQALRARNLLLKQPHPDSKALEGFSQELLRWGEQLIEHRQQLLPDWAPFAETSYARLSQKLELLKVEYRSSIKSDFRVELHQSRDRERVMRTTLVGPHRDELKLTVDGRSIDEFGSEGQKRSVAIALKMAQAEYLTHVHGAPPVLLIDDVIGELDETRRTAFVPLLQRVDQAGSQVFMTATEERWPSELGKQLCQWKVTAGVLTRSS